jgi:3'-5' exoribonuclease
LHDIGKTKEMSWTETGAISYTEEGTLIGHITIGTLILADASRSVAMSSTRTNEIMHLILSHHGNLEWGSPKVPCMLEAMILHFVDMIDSRVASFVETVGKDQSKTNNNKFYSVFCSNL